MANLNMLDKIIAKISPQRALKRELARQRLEFINSGYSHHGANRVKKSLLGWNSTSLSPDEDINENLDLLRQRTRDLYMGGAPIATGAIKTTRTNVVGSGLVLKPSIDPKFLKMTDEEAENWKLTVIREFEYWATSINCDKLRLNNFYELQQLAFLSQLLSGDVFVLLPYKHRKGFIYDLRIQIIESDRVGTPLDKYADKNIHQGIEIKDNEITAYYIFDKHPGSIDFDYKYTKVEAFGRLTGRRNILHMMESERPEQLRGVPFLAPVIESLKQLGQYTHAELTAAVIGSLFTVFVTHNTSSGELGNGLNYSEQIDDEDITSYELGAGTMVNLQNGEGVEFADPSRPNTAFDAFVDSIVKQVGTALEIPYELLVKHFSASYSASRAALLEAWKMFRMRRFWLASDFCQPIYEEWLTEAVAKGRIYAPRFFDDPIIRNAYCKAEWHGPSQGQIDPLKEVNAATKRIEEGLSTRQKEAAELTGTDFNVNINQRIKEEIKINELKNLQGGNQNSSNNANTK